MVLPLSNILHNMIFAVTIVHAYGFHRSWKKEGKRVIFQCQGKSGSWWLIGTLNSFQSQRILFLVCRMFFTFIMSENDHLL